MQTAGILNFRQKKLSIVTGINNAKNISFHLRSNQMI